MQIILLNMLWTLFSLMEVSEKREMSFGKSFSKELREETESNKLRFFDLKSLVWGKQLTRQICHLKSIFARMELKRLGGDSVP